MGDGDIVKLFVGHSMYTIDKGTVEEAWATAVDRSTVVTIALEEEAPDELQAMLLSLHAL